jgi:hypothetical protein
MRFLLLKVMGIRMHAAHAHTNKHLYLIAFLPMALVIDSWRWDIFTGKTTAAEYNCKWWDLRRRLQGFKPPNVRTSADFDAGAKYHVAYGRFN